MTGAESHELSSESHPPGRLDRARSAAIVVAIATFRRPDQLMEMLPGVVAQVNALSPDGAHRVVVVDNDPDASAKAAVAAWSERQVDYVHEPKPGIAAARNCALAAAGDADAIVFIDDDEEPMDGWLEAIVRTWQDYRCQAVAGPVVPVLGEEASPWVKASPMFQPVRRTTGEQVPSAWSGNLLLDLSAIRRLELSFSDEYGLTGGSDTLLARTLVKHGGVIRWCDEAVVHEAVPVARADREWVLRRHVRIGNGWSRVQLDLADTRLQRAKCRANLAARGVIRVSRGLLLVTAGRISSNVTRRAVGECHVAAGRGVLGGAFGSVVTEYLRAPKT